MAKYVRLDTLAYRESAGTPDARTIYYNYPSSGDGAVIARLVPIAAVKNPARKPTRDRGIRYCVPRIATDMGKTWAQYDLKELGRRSPTRFHEKNGEGWFRVDLRTGWVQHAEVLFIKPKQSPGGQPG